jgi:hypothetical protein
LCRAFPAAQYVGVDIAAGAGRRCTIDRARTWFGTMTSSQLRATRPEPFDLVVIADVLHHIPADADRRAVLEDAAAMAAGGGTVIVKEWSGHRSLGYGFAYAADRFVSGDRHVRFSTESQIAALVGEALPGWGLAWREVVPPWANNIVLAFERC